MPIQQSLKINEMKQISERIVAAIAHQPKVESSDVRRVLLRKLVGKDLDQLEKEIAILKRQLNRIDILTQAGKELDELRMDIEDRRGMWHSKQFTECWKIINRSQISLPQLQFFELQPSQACYRSTVTESLAVAFCESRN